MMAEKTAAERRYAKRESEEKKKEVKHAEEPSGAPKEAAAKEEPKGEPAPDARAEMLKRHLKEARDMHGGHRDALKAMHARHEAEMSSQSKMQSPPGNPDGDMDQMTAPPEASEA